MKKKLTMLAALVLVFALGVTGTLAYLTASTKTVTNTFTVGKIEITLAETTPASYKIVPGNTDKKDPTITVTKGSEKCYVYAYVDNALILNNEVVATVNVDTTKWTAVKSDVVGKTLYRYFEVVDASAADVNLPVFTTISYDGTKITADNINSLDGKKVSIAAFAHQSANVSEVPDATAIAHFSTTNP